MRKLLRFRIIFMFVKKTFAFFSFKYSQKDTKNTTKVSGLIGTSSNIRGLPFLQIFNNKQQKLTAFPVVLNQDIASLLANCPAQLAQVSVGATLGAHGSRIFSLRAFVIANAVRKFARRHAPVAHGTRLEFTDVRV